ncbi:putative quinol monooxygenase [Metaclostridioides mangenotii]|uniref:putative quinol monooxygenase n=1 Tax=Metaclostridioides mangenotii TaxID=1540 RepID=UPI0026F01FED|nr:putative quinol monooxygenase [Clostridioides mangenotii]
MIKIIAKFFIKEDEFEKALQLCEKLVAKTRKEAGCVSYEVYQDNNDKNQIVILEEWKSQEYLDKHSQANHFKFYVPQIVALSTEKITNFYSKVL